jgi:hypothetical protein
VGALRPWFSEGATIAPADRRLSLHISRALLASVIADALWFQQGRNALHALQPPAPACGCLVIVFSGSSGRTGNHGLHRQRSRQGQKECKREIAV